jgi:hypothetical protein
MSDESTGAALLVRLRATHRRYDLETGGGTISASGEATSWSNGPVYMPANPDGPAAAAEIERLRGLAKANNQLACMNGDHRDEWRAKAVALAEALETFVAEYVALVNSGDAGFWDPETEPKVIAARAALASVDRCGEAGETRSEAKGLDPKDESAVGAEGAETPKRRDS